MFPQNFLLRKLKAHRNQLLLVLLAASSVAYASIGILSWKFAVVGDEWAFFDFAKDLARRHLLVNPFSMRGVYGVHRIFESYSQAIFLFLFGARFAVWKFSSVFMLFPSILLLYAFVRRRYEPKIAWFSVIFLAFSKYLGNFFKIGYAHSFCFCLFLLCLYWAHELLTVPTKRNAVKLGGGLGLSFFAYIGPLFPFFFAPFGLALLRRERQKALPLLARVFGVYLLFFGLGLVSTPRTEWLRGLEATPLNPQINATRQIALNIGRNFLLFFQNFDYVYNHFVAGPYLDGMTRWLALLGIVLSLCAFRQKGGLLLALWIFLCIGLGLISPYYYIESTRGIFYIPYGAIFAGIGLNWLRQRIGQRWSKALLPAVLLAAISLNIYEAHVGLFAKVGYTRTALILRELVAANQRQTAVLVFHSDRYEFNPGYVLVFMEIYGIPPARFALTQSLQEACVSEREKIILFQDDPLWRQTTFAEACAGFQPKGTVSAIQGAWNSP